jgi:hypothetical protein
MGMHEEVRTGFLGEAIGELVFAGAGRIGNAGIFCRTRKAGAPGQGEHKKAAPPSRSPHVAISL